ncbi:MAG: hypothetical protein R3343_07755 [Nitriliruptorales bacterium]|nr:hypothetical protein [Nitriliruptorales bacterium]
MPRTLRRTSLLLVLVLALAACGDGGDPEERLADAFEDTFDGSFAYEFTVDADSEALGDLGDGAGQAAAFLGGFSVSGTVAEETASFGVTLLNQQIFELRTIGEEAFYLRLGINDLLAAFGGGAFDPQDELVPAIDALGLGEDIKAAVIDAFNGTWVGVEGEFDSEELSALFGAGADDVDDEESRERVREVFGEDIPGFFERFVTVTEEEEEDDVHRFTVALEIRELLRAAAELNEELGVDDSAAFADLEADLEDLPETVPGTVITADGLVEVISFDVAAAAREVGEDVAGAVEIRFEISDHDEVEAVVAPEEATTLTAEQFAEAVRKLTELTGGLGAVPGS